MSRRSLYSPHLTRPSPYMKASSDAYLEYVCDSNIGVYFCWPIRPDMTFSVWMCSNSKKSSISETRRRQLQVSMTLGVRSGVLDVVSATNTH